MFVVEAAVTLNAKPVSSQEITAVAQHPRATTFQGDRGEGPSR